MNFLITISAVYLMGMSQGNIYNRFFLFIFYEEFWESAIEQRAETWE